MTRVYRGLLLVAVAIALSAGSAEAQAIGQIFGKVTDPSGGMLPGVTVTVHGPALQRPLVAVTTESGSVPVPQRADRHVHRDVRARQLQEGGRGRTS